MLSPVEARYWIGAETGFDGVVIVVDAGCCEHHCPFPNSSKMSAMM
jgi:hypothetical protein